MIPRLPYWVLTDKTPAFYDSESKTVLEMVAKIYAKMNELVDHYNEFVDPLNQEIDEHYKQLQEEYECFKASMIKIAHDYIMTIDEKIKMQDLVIKQYYESFVVKLDEYMNLVNEHMKNQDTEIQEAVNYMKTNIKETTQEVANDLLLNGEISVNHTYFSSNKKVLLAISNSGIIYNDENKQLNIMVRTEV